MRISFSGSAPQSARDSVVPILHLSILRGQRYLLPPVDIFLMSQTPPVDDVLHRLKDVPETNFSSMVQEVHPILVTWVLAPPTWELTRERAQFHSLEEEPS